MTFRELVEAIQTPRPNIMINENGKHIPIYYGVKRKQVAKPIKDGHDM